MFVSREAWGSVSTSRTQVYAALPELFIHHTGAGSIPADAAAEMLMMRNLQAYAIRPKAEGGKGYHDLDYNLLVGNVTGNIYEGRGLDYGSAATLDRNQVSRSICAIGNYETANPTGALLEGIIQAAALLVDAGRLAADAVVYGHRDNPAHPAATSCPGRLLYAHLPYLAHRISTLEADDMSTARMVRENGYLNVWLVGSGPALHLSPEVAESYKAEGVQMIVQTHPQLLKAMLAQSGMTEADLVPGGS